MKPDKHERNYTPYRVCTIVDTIAYFSNKRDALAFLWLRKSMSVADYVYNRSIADIGINTEIAQRLANEAYYLIEDPHECQ